MIINPGKKKKPVDKGCGETGDNEALEKMREQYRSLEKEVQTLREAEEALCRDRDKYRMLFDNTGDAICIHDLSGRLREINQVAIDRLGYSRDELLAMNVKDLYTTVYAPQGAEHIDDVRKRRYAVFESAHLRRDGSTLPVEIISRIVDFDGQPMVLNIASDITERKRVENALHKLRENLEKSQEIAHLGIWELDIGTDRLEWSDEVYRIFGVQPGEFDGTYKAFLQYVYPGDRIAVDAAYWDSVRERRDIYEIGHRVVRKSDGEIRFVREKCDHFRDESGIIVRSVGIVQDITDQKLSEEALAEARISLERSLKFTEALISAIPTPLFYKDREGRYLGCNHAFTELMGFTSDQLRGKMVQDLWPEEYSSVYRTKDLELMNNPRIQVYEFKVRDKNGVDHPVIWAKSVFRDENDQVAGIVGTFIDITERKRAEEELKAAKAQAELYVDLMGHDINNLNQSILGYLELAMLKLETTESLGRDDIGMLESPIQAVIRSSRLIDNVQKLQKLSTTGIKTEPLDLQALFEELRTIQFSKGERYVTINIQTIPHYRVMANELLRNVFTNLIINAIIHSDPIKPLTVDIRTEPITRKGRKLYRCTVEDNGPGIPDAVKEKLFYRYQRGETKTYGKGLGLFLARTLVEGYGGQISVEDRVEGDHARGARFVVLLPAVE